MLWSVATTAVLFLLTLPAGLHQDDLLNLQLHRAAGSPLDMLMAPVFLTQIAPGFQALTALQLWLGPTDRVIIHAAMAALGGGSVWVAGRIGHRVGVGTRLLPVALALVIAGPAGLAVVLWYAAAYHFMPSMFFGLLSVLLYLRWRGSPTGPLPSGAPLLSVLTVALGLLFSLKAGIAVVFIVLLEYVLLRRGDLETVILGLWKDRRVWFTYGLLLALYLAISQRAGLDPPVGPPTTIVAAVARGLLGMTAPMFAGFGSAELDYTAPVLPTWMFVISWVATAGVVLFCVRRGPIAQRGLAVSGVMLVVGLVVTAGPRTSFLGESAAFAPRYHLEGMVYTVLAIAIALTVQRWHQATLGAPPPPPSGRRLMARRALVIALVAGIAGATAWSHDRRLQTAPSMLSGAWIDTLETELAAADDARVLDTNVPWYVIEVVPGSRMDLLDGLVPGLDVVAADPDTVVTPDGEFEPLRTEELFRETGARFLGNALVAFDEDEPPIAINEDLCAPDEVRFFLPVAPHPAPRLLALGPGTPVDVEVQFLAVDGRAPEPTARAAGGPEVDELVLPLDLLGWVRGVEVVVRPLDDGPACLRSVSILELRNELPVPRVDQ